MPISIRISAREARERQTSWLPPGTHILCMEHDVMNFGYVLWVEFPFAWCVDRVNGPGLRGDLRGADYDGDGDVETTE